MRVVATHLGFYDGSLREPGTEFEVPGSFEASWVVPAGSPAGAAARPKPAGRTSPRALSELSRPGKSFIEQHGSADDELA